MKFVSRTKSTLTLAALAIGIMLSSCDKDDTAIYLPEQGDKAIVFIHKFNFDDYEEGKRIVVENFSDAIDGSGQTRRTYFTSEPDSAKVYVVSFFHANSSTTEWLNSEERDEVLAMLQPLYREPLGVQQYDTESIHNTHESEGHASYFPEPGDELLVFRHLIRPEAYETATSIIKNFATVLETTDQKRRSYSLLNPANSEIVGISFFHPDGDIEEWLTHEDRQVIADQLSELIREPSTVDKYSVEKVHDSN